MKSPHTTIGIVTVYDAIDNLGSFLQAYALKYILESKNFGKVKFIQYEPKYKKLLKLFKTLRPYRSLSMRLKRVFALGKLWKELSVSKINDNVAVDILLYGSDEIWNMDNPYFKTPFFFGGGYKDTPKLAYAVSVGAMSEQTLLSELDIAGNISLFKYILCRDTYSQSLLSSHIRGARIDKGRPVCDPTLLCPLDELTRPIRLPKERYILVYTYGIDNHFIEYIKRFAKENGLIIISAGFWHIWADISLECSPFQMPYLMKHAEFVFTTTFHGAIFALYNNTRCCIYPQRPKVMHLVEELDATSRVVSESIAYEEFSSIISHEFDAVSFNSRLKEWRNYSLHKLQNALLSI